MRPPDGARQHLQALQPARLLHPPLRDPRFWLVQAMLVSIAAAHLAVDAAGLLRSTPFPASETVGLLLLPVGYAAVSFGLGGSVATAVWACILWLPDLMLPGDQGQPWADLVELALVLAVAVLVGTRIEAEREAHARASTAEQDHAAAEEARRKAAQAYAKNLVAIQEEERHRLSRELHDEPVQRLVHLAQRLELMRKLGTSTEGLSASLANALALAHTEALVVIGELRSIARGLRPPVLDDLGLAVALRTLIFEIGHGHATSLEISGRPGRLPADTELGLFRIAQEALNNSARHARASRLEVTLDFASEEVRLRVSDNGTGIPDRGNGETEHPRGLGLIGMRERAEMLGGSLTIRTGQGVGTVVEVTVPAGPPEPTITREEAGPARTHDGSPATMWCATAQRAASVRETTPSFPKTLLT